MLSRTKKRRKFKDSFKNCIDGLRFININEDNFKREILLGIIALVLSYLLKIDKIEFIIIIIVIGLVLVSEIINTAIERLVDLVSPKYNKFLHTGRRRVLDVRDHDAVALVEQQVRQHADQFDRFVDVVKFLHARNLRLGITAVGGADEGRDGDFVIHDAD